MTSQELLYLRQAQLGPMANYVYLIGDPATRKAAAVDPAWEVDAICDLAARDGYEIDKILITHYHPDHLGGSMMGRRIEGAAELLHKVRAKIYVNKHEAELAKRIAGLADSDLVKVDSGDTTSLGQATITFIHTPGHTPGSQCFLVEGNLISGDTLFIGSCGRVNLPGSDPEQMYYSLNHKLRNLDESTMVYPGHAYSREARSTIGEEKRRNFYLRFETLEEFLAAMGYGR